MSSLLFGFFLSTRFFVSVSGYFPPFSLICRRELVRLAKERKGESERRRTKKRYEPSGSFRLLYRRFNVSAVVKGRQTMSSVSHLSLSLSQESYLISFHTSKDTSQHTQGRGKRQKRPKLSGSFCLAGQRARNTLTHLLVYDFSCAIIAAASASAGRVSIRASLSGQCQGITNLCKKSSSLLAFSKRASASIIF